MHYYFHSNFLLKASSLVTMFEKCSMNQWIVAYFIYFIFWVAHIFVRVNYTFDYTFLFLVIIDILIKKSRWLKYLLFILLFRVLSCIHYSIIFSNYFVSTFFIKLTYKKSLELILSEMLHTKLHQIKNKLTIISSFYQFIKFYCSILRLIRFYLFSYFIDMFALILNIITNYLKLFGYHSFLVNFLYIILLHKYFS